MEGVRSSSSEGGDGLDLRAALRALDPSLVGAPSVRRQPLDDPGETLALLRALKEWARAGHNPVTVIELPETGTDLSEIHRRAAAELIVPRAGEAGLRTIVDAWLFDLDAASSGGMVGADPATAETVRRATAALESAGYVGTVFAGRLARYIEALDRNDFGMAEARFGAMVGGHLTEIAADDAVTIDLLAGLAALLETAGHGALTLCLVGPNHLDPPSSIRASVGTLTTHVKGGALRKMSLVIAAPPAVLRTDSLAEGSSASAVTSMADPVAPEPLSRPPVQTRLDASPAPPTPPDSPRDSSGGGWRRARRRRRSS